MKKTLITILLALSLTTLCACGNTDNTTNTEKEVSSENAGNFSSEMIIQDSGDVTIVEMP